MPGARNWPGRATRATTTCSHARHAADFAGNHVARVDRRGYKIQLRISVHQPRTVLNTRFEVGYGDSYGATSAACSAARCRAAVAAAGLVPTRSRGATTVRPGSNTGRRSRPPGCRSSRTSTQAAPLGARLPRQHPRPARSVFGSNYLQPIGGALKTVGSGNVLPHRSVPAARIGLRRRRQRVQGHRYLREQRIACLRRHRGDVAGTGGPISISYAFPLRSRRIFSTASSSSRATN